MGHIEQTSVKILLFNLITRMEVCYKCIAREWINGDSTPKPKALLPIMEFSSVLET